MYVTDIWTSFICLFLLSNCSPCPIVPYSFQMGTLTFFESIIWMNDKSKFDQTWMFKLWTPKLHRKILSHQWKVKKNKRITLTKWLTINRCVSYDHNRSLFSKTGRAEEGRNIWPNPRHNSSLCNGLLQAATLRHSTTRGQFNELISIHRLLIRLQWINCVPR